MDKLPTISLLSLLVITFAVAYYIAWRYRDDYDAKRLIKPYLIYAPFLLIGGLILQVSWLLIIGFYLFGLVVLIFRSQHYFNK